MTAPIKAHVSRSMDELRDELSPGNETLPPPWMVRRKLVITAFQ
jgi:hypothetical protein